MYVGVHKISTAPTAEPLDESEIRAHLLAEAGRDDVIASYMKAARIRLEEESGRAFMRQTWTLKLDDFPDPSIVQAGAFDRMAGSSILLPRPPLQSVTSIAYTDTAGDPQTVATTVYGVDTDSEPGRVYLKDGQVWPTDVLDQSLSVTITYICGHSSSATVATQRAAVPETVKQAIRLLTEHYYDLGTTDGIPEAVAALLWSFRTVEFA